MSTKILGVALATLLLWVFFLASGCNVEQHSPVPATVCAVRGGDSVESVPTESVTFLNDYRLGLEAAHRESKPALLFFTVPNCVSSRRMLETTFRDREIRRLSDRFVCISINASADKELCGRYDIEGFPTILFVNAQGLEFQRLSGKQTAEQLSLQMHVAIQSTASRSGLAIRK